MVGLDADHHGPRLGQRARRRQVGEGDRLGRQFGFPTANLDTGGLVLPPNGVYAAQAKAEGRVHRAVLNIGVRPTISAAIASLRFEVHLLGFEGNLYGHELEVTPLERLRDERKFGSVAELQAQHLKSKPDGKAAEPFSSDKLALLAEGTSV